MQGETPPKTNPLARLLSRRLVFVTGKGGVGKTTITGALGLLAAQQNKRVLICEVAATPAFGHIFENKKLGFNPKNVAPGIDVANLDPEPCLVAFITRFVKVRQIAKALVKNRIAKRFFDAAPAVLETVVLERIERLSRDHRQKRASYDFVVVDLPSTGHAITFLDTPRMMAKLAKRGALADHLTGLAERLAKPGWAEIVIVTHLEELPVQESIELWANAKATLPISVETIILNRLRNSHLPREVRQRLLLTKSDDKTSLVQAARLASAWEEREKLLVNRMKQETGANIIEVPWNPGHQRERELLDLIADHLRGFAGTDESIQSSIL